MLLLQLSLAPSASNTTSPEVDATRNDIRHNNRKLAFGASGPAVLDVQKDLNQWLKKTGKSEIALSGKYDEATQMAVASLQQSVGMNRRGEIIHPNSKDNIMMVGVGEFGVRTIRALDMVLGREVNSAEEFSAAINKSRLHARMEMRPAAFPNFSMPRVDFLNRGKPIDISEKPFNITFGGDIHALILDIAQKKGVNPFLALAVAHVESGFNPRAVSPKGAVGVFQLMPGAAHDTGVTNRFDPVQNITGGIEYLRQMQERYGENALWAYNAGGRRVEAGVLPRETRDYIQRVNEIAARLQRQAGAPSTDAS